VIYIERFLHSTLLKWIAKVHDQTLEHGFLFNSKAICGVKIKALVIGIGRDQ